jgi:hypothetical protein
MTDAWMHNDRAVLVDHHVDGNRVWRARQFDKDELETMGTGSAPKND